MINISDYLKGCSDRELEDILQYLQEGTDQDNILVLLQLYHVNILAELEDIIRKLREIEKDEDMDENIKKKIKEKLLFQHQLAKKEESGLRKAIESILERPAYFWKGEHEAESVRLLPDKASDRDRMAKKAMIKILMAKRKDLSIQKGDSMETVIRKINEVSKQHKKDHLLEKE